LIIILISIIGCKKDIQNINVISWVDSFVFETGSTSKDSTVTKIFTKLSVIMSTNMGVPGQKSTQTKVAILNNKILLTNPIIIWRGRNNSTDTGIIIDDLNSIVKEIRHPNYLILEEDRASYEQSKNNVGNRIKF
jgi:hypothetical protein